MQLDFSRLLSPGEVERLGQEKAQIVGADRFHRKFNGLLFFKKRTEENTLKFVMKVGLVKDYADAVRAVEYMKDKPTVYHACHCKGKDTFILERTSLRSGEAALKLKYHHFYDTENFL